MKVKIILANVSIIIISVCVLLNGYVMSLQMPVYADSTIDEWMNVTTNAKLVEAFRYYCKSRDLTIDGSIADGVTKFTTQTFNGLCKTLGIDITALQAHLKYQTDSNLGLRFLFDQTGISAYNRIFSQFLQDNNLQVGDSANEQNNTIYSGTIYTDSNGTSCLVWIVDGDVSGSNDYPLSTIKFRGNQYIYTEYDLVNLRESAGSNVNVTFPLSGSGQTLAVTKTINDSSTWDSEYYTLKFTNSTNQTRNIAGYSEYKNNYRNAYDGYPIIYYLTTDNTYHLGCYSVTRREAFNDSWEAYTKEGISNFKKFVPTEGQSVNVTVFLTTNNTVINNNNYEGDTIINNNGDTDDSNDGGGNDNPNPVTPPGNIGGDGTDGTINFPDFNINLPEINWSLGDLSNKFPFSIPFDMIAFLRLLNGDPVAPHITGSIPLTSHYTWELDLDFSQFDTFAGIMRGLEFVGFMFFLISATINIVRG